MSKGTDRITFRCPPALAVEIKQSIEKTNGRDGCPFTYNLTDFIIQACRERLAHLARGSKRGKKQSKGGRADCCIDLHDVIKGPHHKPTCAHFVKEGGQP